MDVPVDVFISYALEDEPLRKELVDHLATMRRENLIRAWDQRQVAAGDAYQATIERHFAAARIIVLLASPSYVTSDYLHDVEMTQALDRAKVGNARVIPVIIRAFDCGTLFEGLQVLPRNGFPVTSCSNRDEVWKEVALEIREAIGRAPAVQADPPPRNNQSAYEPVYEAAWSRALADELEQAQYEDAQAFGEAPRRAAAPLTRDEQFWRRRGSEAQIEDWVAWSRDALTKADAASVLATYFDDLPDDEDERRIALDWAAEAYVDDLRAMRRIHADEIAAHRYYLDPSEVALLNSGNALEREYIERRAVEAARRSRAPVKVCSEDRCYFTAKPNGDITPEAGTHEAHW